jgi:hypothetical protein
MAKKQDRIGMGTTSMIATKSFKNHLAPNAPYEGAWFETYSIEQDFIYAISPECVWTIVETDGVLWIIAGRHYVDRLGYLITTKCWSDENEAFLFG